MRNLDGANNTGDNLDGYDSALLVLNGNLTFVSGARFRQNDYTVYDYGDAPDTYGTLYSAVNGAEHHKYVSDYFVVTDPATGRGRRSIRVRAVWIGRRLPSDGRQLGLRDRRSAQHGRERR